MKDDGEQQQRQKQRVHHDEEQEEQEEDESTFDSLENGFRYGDSITTTKYITFQRKLH